MKKRRIKRGRALSIATLGLAAVSLVSVGFSAWIIQVDSVQHTEQITATVADVTNQSLHIGDISVTDDKFILDAAKDDSAGEITASNSQEKYNFSIEFNMVITNTTLFKGIGIKAHERIKDNAETDATTLNALSNAGGQINMPVPMVSAYKGDIFNTDTTSPTYTQDKLAKETFDKEKYFALVSSDWITMGEGVTISYYTQFLDKGDTVAKVDIPEGQSEPLAVDYNRKVTISRGTEADSTKNVYTFAVEFKVEWGTDYLGFNPSLCDGANETANNAFTAADKKMPSVSQIETDLNNLKKVSGNGLILELIHSPTTPYSIS